MPNTSVLYSGQIDAKDLTHGEIVEGRFGNQTIFGGKYWSDLLGVSLGLGYKVLLAMYGERTAAIRKLSDRAGCEVKIGHLEDHKAIPNTNLCVRYRDAQSSWYSACAMADLLDTDIELTVRWKHPEAKYANTTRILRHESSKVAVWRLEREIFGEVISTSADLTFAR